MYTNTIQYCCSTYCKYIIEIQELLKHADPNYDVLVITDVLQIYDRFISFPQSLNCSYYHPLTEVKCAPTKINSFDIKFTNQYAPSVVSNANIYQIDELTYEYETLIAENVYHQTAYSHNWKLLLGNKLAIPN